jgi:NADH:ubiquinone oxidoreductase subunit F (NADH-binding)
MTTIERVQSASRLIADSPGAHGSSLDAHLRRHGRMPMPDTHSSTWADQLIDEIDRSGLTGRGGGGFPTARKLRLVRAAGHRPTLVVNAMEGEPASNKDRFLLSGSPHLVLDGAELVATALRATEVVICMPHDRDTLARHLEGVIAARVEERNAAVRTRVLSLPARFIAGEESALVAQVAGRSGVPRFRPDKSEPLRIGRGPALVQNAETLAHVALIARYGAAWFREIGAPEAPGTCLVTVSGAVGLPGVIEVPTGTPVAEIVASARPERDLQAVLVGGFGGAWVSREEIGTPYAPHALGAVGASRGAGVLVALSDSACGIRETELIAGYMARESAGQCGPCVFGLPAIAEELHAIADGHAGPRTLDRLIDRCGVVDGRGACRHPDGVVRLVRSALAAFGGDVASHLRGAACAASRRPSTLFAPSKEAGRR